MAFKPYNYQRYQGIGHKNQAAVPERTLMPKSGMSFNELDSYRGVMSNYERAMQDWYYTQQGSMAWDLRTACQIRANEEGRIGHNDCGHEHNN